MFEVKMFSFLQGDEELWAVGVLSTIGHGKYAWARVPDIEVLIFELVAVDGFTPWAIAFGDITTLWGR